MLKEKYTRAEYMKGSITHQEYYEHLADILGVYINKDDYDGHSLIKAYKLDKHFNTIPIAKWDRHAWHVARHGNAERVKYIRDHIDQCFGSEADYVYIVKEAERRYVVEKLGD